MRPALKWLAVVALSGLFACGDSVGPISDMDALSASDTVGAQGCAPGCQEGTTCRNDKCIPDFCPPEGPFGLETGESFTDVVVKDCDGNDVHIHELCGAPAGFFNLLAGW